MKKLPRAAFLSMAFGKISFVMILTFIMSVLVLDLKDLKQAYESGILYSTLGLLVLLTLLTSSINFFTFRYELKDEILRTQRGLLLKSIVEIPFSKIQGANTSQNLVEQLFKLTTLRFSTNGSSRAWIPGIPTAEANSIKDKILQK